MPKKRNVIRQNKLGARQIVVLDADFSKGYPQGRDLYYLCRRCGDAVASSPTDNVGCSCGNLFIDVDSFRLATEYDGLIALIEFAREV